MLTTPLKRTRTRSVDAHAVYKCRSPLCMIVFGMTFPFPHHAPRQVLQDVVELLLLLLLLGQDKVDGIALMLRQHLLIDGCRRE